MSVIENFSSPPEPMGDFLPPPPEQWPSDVSLYQPYQVAQITLPDYAQCLAVETFLRMSGLSFRVEQRTNAAEMSPTGKSPFIKVGSQLIAGFDSIVAYTQSKGFNLNKNLPEQTISEIHAYISLVDTTLGNAEHFLAWLVPEIASEVTKPRFGCAHPWPLSWLLPWMKQREVRRELKHREWAGKSLGEVTENACSCLKALSEKLGSARYFSGGSPTELDALVFGHLYALQTSKLPGSVVHAAVTEHANLVDFCKRIESTYFL